jgi:predicted nuclease with TOPRIM domain
MKRMDISKILGEIKGKALDAAHFDLLKHAYDLQNENIEQLKSNNEALKESNQLLLDKLERLEKENELLRKSVECLKQQVVQSSDTFHAGGLTEVARDVLRLYVQQDTTDLFDGDIIGALAHSRIHVEAALDELRKGGILDIGGRALDGGKSYLLTGKGKKYLTQGNVQSS